MSVTNFPSFAIVQVSRMGAILRLGAIAIVICAVVATEEVASQERDREVPSTMNARRADIDRFPGPFSDADLLLSTPDGSPNGLSTKFGIHLCDPTSPRHKPGLVYLRPVFMFIEAEKAIDDYPTIVHFVSNPLYGERYVRFRLRQITPDIQRLAKAAFYDQRPNLVAEFRENGGDLEVRPWPLLHLVLECRDRRSDTLLSVGQTGSLANLAEIIEIQLPFSDESLQTFKEQSAIGEIYFVPIYTYCGRRVYSGTVELKGSAEVSSALTSVLTSKQLDGELPVIQGQANAVIAKVLLKVRQTARATHKDLLPQLTDGSNLAAQIFEPYEKVAWSSAEENPELMAIIAKYLEPRMTTLENKVAAHYNYSEKDEGESTDETKTSEDDTYKRNGKSTFGITIPIEGVTVGISNEDERTRATTDSESQSKSVRELNAATKDLGITWSLSESKQEFQPHEIEVTKAKLRDASIEMDSIATSWLAIDHETSVSEYLCDSSVLVWRTEKDFEELLRKTNPDGLEVHIAGYSTCPKGTLLPFMGVTPPPGWIFLDGIGEYPHEPWVPPHLKGKSIPNASNCFLANAEDLEHVGEVRTPEPTTIKRQRECDFRSFDQEFRELLQRERRL